jgi:hypothetical protein
VNRPHDHGHGEEHEDQEDGSGDVHSLSATPDLTENLAVLMPPGGVGGVPGFQETHQAPLAPAIVARPGPDRRDAAFP